MYDGWVQDSSIVAAVRAALRNFSSAVRDFSRGYFQGPPGC